MDHISHSGRCYRGETEGSFFNFFSNFKDFLKNVLDNRIRSKYHQSICLVEIYKKYIGSKNFKSGPKFRFTASQGFLPEKSFGVSNFDKNHHLCVSCYFWLWPLRVDWSPLFTPPLSEINSKSLRIFNLKKTKVLISSFGTFFRWNLGKFWKLTD